MAGRKKKNQRVILGIALLVTLFSAVVSIAESAGVFRWSDLFSGFGLDDAVISDSPLSVHIIDVGNADSIFILSGGVSMLVDAGDNNSGDAVVNYLKKQSVEKLDIVIATHPDEDHIGGMDKVVLNIPVDTFIMPRMPDNLTPTSKTYRDLLAAIKEKGLKITSPVVGNKYNLGDAVAEILAPVKTSYKSENDFSVVTKLTLGGTSFLLTGDAEKAAERDILASGADISADVLKVGHHGSKTSTTEAFLKEVSPKYAVISAGSNNRYGHPSDETVALLQKYGVDIKRTDRNGTVVYESNGKDITVTCEKSR